MKERLSRRSFILAGLELLEQEHSLRSLNLRKIAKRVGCAHTNVYNYVGSFEELLWLLLDEAIRILLSYGQIQDPNDRYVTSPGRDLIDAYITFAIEHPALYHLIWDDLLQGAAPAEVQATMEAPGRLFREYLENLLGEQDEIAYAARIIMCYLHGELSIFVSGRSSEEAEMAASTISRGAHRLLGLLSSPASGRPQHPYMKGVK